MGKTGTALIMHPICLRRKVLRQWPHKEWLKQGCPEKVRRLACAVKVLEAETSKTGKIQKQGGKKQCLWFIMQLSFPKLVYVRSL